MQTPRGGLERTWKRGRGRGAKRLPPAGTASQVRANRETVFQTDADLVPAPWGTRAARRRAGWRGSGAHAWGAQRRLPKETPEPGRRGRYSTPSSSCDGDPGPGDARARRPEGCRPGPGPGPGGGRAAPRAGPARGRTRARSRPLAGGGAAAAAVPGRRTTGLGRRPADGRTGRDAGPAPAASPPPAPGRAMAASPGSGGANPRKFSEKIALHTQRQAEETRAFEQLMTDLTLSRVSAGRAGGRARAEALAGPDGGACGPGARGARARRGARAARGRPSGRARRRRARGRGPAGGPASGARLRSLRRGASSRPRMCGGTGKCTAPPATEGGASRAKPPATEAAAERGRGGSAQPGASGTPAPTWGRRARGGRGSAEGPALGVPGPPSRRRALLIRPAQCLGKLNPVARIF